jgi:hypothetical protein
MTTTPLVVIVAGSRTIKLLACMNGLDDVLRDGGAVGRPTLIYSGGAAGPDQAGIVWARRERIECRLFIPDWGMYGRSAGAIRNLTMAKEALRAVETGGRAALVAFWDGTSRGTKNMIDGARKHGLSVTVHSGKP